MAILPVVLFCIACNIDGPEGEAAKLEEFLKKEQAGLYGMGGYLFRYSQENCQISVNKRRLSVRLQNDNQSNYVHIKLSGFPATPKEKIEVGLSYNVGGEDLQDNCIMEVVNCGTDKMWLWDNKKHTGLILPVCW